MSADKIYVTKPSLPPVDEFKNCLGEIWESTWITNNGKFHEKFENKLKDYLNVDYLSLVSNGTLALLLALKCLGRKGEIITTPFTFVATVNAIEWLGFKPVFCDINEDDYNIDTSRIEELINENTVAIMPVHVFGLPCDNKALDRIAKENNLKLIYDAAHAFNVKKDEEVVLNYGDISILSFHATKSFNTIEGGAVICHSQHEKNKIDQLRNFGYDSHNVIVRSGINAKMNELQAAYGLLQLNYSSVQILKRKKVFTKYISALNSVKGINLPVLNENIKHNYSYFPIRVTNEYNMSRNNLVDCMNNQQIYPRKYFYPLISNMIPYKNIESGMKECLPVANIVAEEILCLPIYEDLLPEDQNKIIEIIKK